MPIRSIVPNRSCSGARLARATFRCGFIGAFMLAGCSKLDSVLEGPTNPEPLFSVGVAFETITIPAGGDTSVVVTLARRGTFAGAVLLTTERVPDGVTATLLNEQTNGQITTATLRLHVDSSASLGTVNLGLRGHASPSRDVTAQVTISIAPILAYGLSVSVPSVTIARGGIARAAAAIARTNYTLPISLALDGTTGISAIFDNAPPGGTNTPFTIAVASTVPAGTYQVAIRGVGAGVTDRVVPLTVNVINDPLQLLAGDPLVAPQLATVTTDIIVNRAGQVGAVVLSAENLPHGVVAVPQPVIPGTTVSTLIVQVTAAASPGTSTIRVRARAAGVPDATTDIQLTVTEARIEFKALPATVDIFQGTTVRSTVAIARTDYAGEVAFTVDNAPAGLSVTVLPSPTRTDTVVLDISATVTALAGTHILALRAQPSLLTSSAVRVASVPVQVRAASTAAGNVLLDWSSCDAPAWVAGQDGSGPWLRLDPVSGTFRFSVTQGKGGFAYASPAQPLVVRYLTQSELTARPINMCPPTPGLKTIRGRAVHTDVAQQWLYLLGGGSGLSTFAASDFSIYNVRAGSHDLVAWSQPGGGFRALIRRDLNMANGDALDPVDLIGAESFAVLRNVFPISGVVGGGESVTHAITYLTRSECTVNELYVSGTQGFAPNVFGIPPNMQAASDYHHLTVISAGSNTYRAASASFHTFAPRSMVLPPVMNLPSLTSLSGPNKWVRASLGTVAAPYNGTVELFYGDGVRSVKVQASNAYLDGSPTTISTPDLSGVAGFPVSNLISQSTPVTWTVTLKGGDEAASLCTENRSSVLARRSGSM
ncbi:MAG: hypothetical protein ABMA00_16185 [Gemmatimonas sp.]